MNTTTFPHYPGPVTLRSAFNRRMILTLLGCLAFVILGVWMWTQAYTDPTPRFPPWKMHLVGALSVVFFGGGGAVVVWRTVTGAASVTLDADGLVDTTTLASTGRVHWSEITGVEVHQQTLPTVTQRQVPWVRVFVRSPEQVIARSPQRRRRLESNCRMANPPTPVWISCQALKVDAPTLAALIDQYARGYWFQHPELSRPPMPPQRQPGGAPFGGFGQRT